VEIYLPIAELSMNVFVLLGLGAAAGLLAGMFGVGGGFLATPLLIFVGIPPAVAVASQANQVIANSVSSLQVQWRRGNVDFRMGLILLLGGLFGSTAGVWLFTYLKRIGQVDFVIAVAYVVMLSTIGVLMLVESLRTYLRRRRNPEAPRGKLHTHYLVHRLPLKLRFYKSKLYISALLPLGIGFEPVEIVGLQTMKGSDYSGLVKVSHRNCLPDGRRLRGSEFVAADRLSILSHDHAFYGQRHDRVTQKSSYLALQTRHVPGC